MDRYDFTYELPKNFDNRVKQYLAQSGGAGISDVFRRCHYEYEVLDYAYYEGIRGDNWNKKAVNFTIEGTADNITLLQSQDKILKKAINMALKPNESGFLIKNIYYLEELFDGFNLPESNEKRLSNDLRMANNVLGDLISIGERICLNCSYNASTPENQINDAFRDMLVAKGYNEVKDQTRHGISDGGIDAAEVDMLLTQEGKEVALFEAMRLSSVEKNKIGKHINKSISNYNALGTPVFVVAYVNSSAFGTFWESYYKYIKDYEYPYQVTQQIKELAYPNASTRVATIVLSKEGYDFPVYYLAFRIY